MIAINKHSSNLKSWSVVMPNAPYLNRSNTQSEVHISVNKLYPSNILVSSNTAFGLGNSVQGYYYTTNGGTSWSGADILPNSGGGRGDPSTCFDAQGYEYLVSMSPNSTSNPDGYFVQKTTDLGVNWQTQVRGTGPSANFDKEMVTSDNTPNSPYANYFYCAWTVFSGSYSVKFNPVSSSFAPRSNLPPQFAMRIEKSVYLSYDRKTRMQFCWNRNFITFTTILLRHCSKTQLFL